MRLDLSSYVLPECQCRSNNLHALHNVLSAKVPYQQLSSRVHPDRKPKLYTMRRSHNHVAISYQLGAVAVFDRRAGACVCGALDHQLAQSGSRGKMHLHNGMTSDFYSPLRVHIQLNA